MLNGHKLILLLLIAITVVSPALPVDALALLAGVVVALLLLVFSLLLRLSQIHDQHRHAISVAAIPGTVAYLQTLVLTQHLGLPKQEVGVSDLESGMMSCVQSIGDTRRTKTGL